MKKNLGESENKEDYRYFEIFVNRRILRTHLLEWSRSPIDLGKIGGKCDQSWKNNRVQMNE